MLSAQISHHPKYHKALPGLFLLAILIWLPSSAASQQRIIGGVSATSNAWPWMAALVHTDGDAYATQYCGGTLIHSQWVMTAAHCVYDNFGRLVNPADIEVVLGVTNLKLDSEERIGVGRIVVHPDYDYHHSHDADIALLKLETESIQDPIEILSGGNPLEGVDGTVIGWGVTHYSSPSPSRLQQASVPIVDNDTCNDAYTGSSLYSTPPITPGMICAGFLEGGRDSCFGDSGGPLMVRDRGKWKVAGITSWGEGCATPGFFGVYTRVSAYAGFIEDHVPPPVPPVRLYFPYVVSDGMRDTEIEIINSGSDITEGRLRVFNMSGEEMDESLDVSLSPFGRKILMVGTEFLSASNIRYAIYETDKDRVAGYERIFGSGFQELSLPAISEINSGDLYLPLAISNRDLETEIHLLNTTSETRRLHFHFGTGEEVFLTLTPHAHKTLTFQALFGETPPAGLASAVIENSSGVIGIHTLEIAGAGGHRQSTGFQLTDHLTSDLSCFHLGNVPDWWTGMVIYNPWNTVTEVTIVPYADNGRALPSSTFQIEAMERYVSLYGDPNLPPEAAWFRATTSQPVAGFDIVGSRDGKLLAGKKFTPFSTSEGLFPGMEHDGWTAIVLWNTEDRMNAITLKAYDENGIVQSAAEITLSPHQRYLAATDDLFENGISFSSHIHFKAEGNLSAFQISGSADGKMLDTLPALDIIARRGSGEEHDETESAVDPSSPSDFSSVFLALFQ